MIDRYTKLVLTVIAVNLTVIVADTLLSRALPDAWAQETIPVYVEGGVLDYETDVTSGPRLRVCTDC